MTNNLGTLQLIFTLQSVEDGEQVHHDHPARPEGEEAHGPRQAQEDGETGHRLQVRQRAGAVCWRLIGSHLSDLNQNHHEHGDVAQQDQENKCHHGHIEDGVVLQPAAGGRRTCHLHWDLGWMSSTTFYFCLFVVFMDFPQSPWNIQIRPEVLFTLHSSFKWFYRFYLFYCLCLLLVSYRFEFYFYLLFSLSIRDKLTYFRLSLRINTFTVLSFDLVHFLLPYFLSGNKEIS